MGLIPGVGTIGWGDQTAHGFEVDQPFFRGANADLNMTLAMALVFFACWIVWAVREIGPVGFLLHLFAPKGETTGVLKVLMIVVFFAVGCLEVFSILFRPVSLSFRLYGNIFAGENMLEAMSNLVPALGWLLPIPFYFMELLVGMVQALVFMLLTAVFTMLICQHEEGARGGAALNIENFGGLTVFNRGSRRAKQRKETYMSLMPMLAEIEREPARRSGGARRGPRRGFHRHEGFGSGGTQSRRRDEDPGAVDPGHRLRGSHRVLRHLPGEVG